MQIYKDATKKHWMLHCKCDNIYNEKSIKIIKMSQKGIECHIVNMIIYTMRKV